MQAQRFQRGRRRRRAGVIVQVAIFSTVMIGMGALAIDIGAMYTARTELQAAVDSAALAAAAQLAGDGVNEPTALARASAAEYARLNAVFGTYAGVDGTRDVEFGKATYDAQSRRFTFSPGGTNFDAVRITARRTSDSEGGPLSLSFANLFGRSTKDLWARATAVLIPRDIAVVIDLSGSMNDDSELQHYKRYQGDNNVWRDGVQINLRDIWCSLNGPTPNRPYAGGSELSSQYAGDTGPTIGQMNTWGSEVIPETYNPSTDPGLWYIPKNANCTAAACTASLVAQGYTADERSKLLSGSYDGTSNVWRNRVAVILGLATWKSGRPGGRAGGDGDVYVESGELTYTAYPSWRKSWAWNDYINYVGSNSTSSNLMYGVNNNFLYRFGLKTFTNFLLEQRSKFSDTVLWGTPEQPLQAVKDAVQAMSDTITSLQSLDHASLEIFGTTVHHEVNLTDLIYKVPERLYQLQSSHYDGSTNIAGGIQQGIIELTGSRARSSSAKVLVLMSDGKPNVDSNGDYVGTDNQQVVDWCYDRARAAADAGIRIYTIGVGSDVDVDLMTQIATLANGQFFHAEGTPDEYRDQLEMIFRTLGGKRPVALIE